jgi:dephospho-CoA kinase
MSTTTDAMDHPVILLGGGIGAGKSRVASVFAQRGFEVIEADKVGHDVLRTNTNAIAAVGAAWPETVDDGVVDRAALARIVFADPDALATLEAITHPVISDTLLKQVETVTDPVLIEVPLMKVLARAPYLRVAVVADTRTREDRAVARGSERDDVRRRMGHQPSAAEWIAWADRSIDNSQEWDRTEVRVHALIDEVLGNG